jgi:uncharacterized membrane protein YhaH (DUF805 family)
MGAMLSTFDFRGRLSRGGFWFQTILVWILFAVANTFFSHLLGNTLTLLFCLLAISALVSLSIRRLHDRNISGKWFLIILLPIVGAAWLFWQLAFRKGIVDKNRWGNNPLATNTDFLVVK